MIEYDPELAEKTVLASTSVSVTEEEFQTVENCIHLAEGMKNFDITDDLDNIQCPVLAIGDKEDQVLGASATENIRQYIAQKPGF